ncbi:cytochrome d ubiquinol oxidase subunit II [Enterobacteriaceae endosymbiont of Donacia bicoloricornis]|uniref:cytochrome d ubiquinol oxidase subunit II n=1 Tax=Enterobacteriaceae endosymbiont of Donacia bicoloricornis TaxID=2675772 RepID=UPI001449A75D|nr:cytochrome d ubiquinol oxidase subunit II [Enterobacteriaceae endosymbiont of Donacia bicoloricornis]QJC37732.1 cytochrome d ubiquinol oxidase subunit II [Enterobacteriaceae endosymbiont of Donacia bicoloricornis]
MLNYEFLCLIWSIIIGILITGFFITDGLDMGVGILLFITGKNNIERRIMINTIAPHWDGNQVWLITTGGALFAAWPIVYAIIFSHFYIMMILLLMALFLRPVGFEYRSKIENKTWQKICDICISIGSIIPPIIIGIIFSNILKGIPFYIDKYNFIYSKRHFLKQFNLLSLIISFTTVILIVNHAITYLQIRIKDSNINNRLKKVLKFSSILLIIFSLLSFINILFFMKGYKINFFINQKTNIFYEKNYNIIYKNTAWTSNFQNHKYLYLIPLLSIILPFFTILSSIYKKLLIALICSTFTIISSILSIGIIMFPFIIPSNIKYYQSLTIWNATSSQLTLNVMLYIVIIFMPIVLFYTFWCYKKMFFYLNKEKIKQKSDFFY